MKIGYLTTKAKNCGLALMAVAMLAPSAHAQSLFFAPPAQTVGIGDTAVVELRISGLSDFTAPSLGGWSFGISYDPLIVDIDFPANVTFGTALNPAGQPASDTAGDSLVAGTLNLSEVSFSDPAVLNSAQAGAFTLATLRFTALAIGTSPLTINVLELSDQNGAAITDFSNSTGSITVTRGGPVGVPEGGAGLLAIALVWCLMFFGLQWHSKLATAVA